MKNLLLNRKEKIILSTIDLINEIGIKELSIKEIAKRENVTEASLYKHFKSKEQILLEVLDYYSKYDIHIINTLNNNQKDEKENILEYFRLYSVYYESYPAVTSIFSSYQVMLYDEKLGAKVRQIINQKVRFMEDLIISGQKNGNISSNIEPENLICILSGSFEKVIVTWRLSNFEFSFKDKALKIINDILKL